MAVPPLAGIRVVEVGNFMAAPFCAMQLADLGADVVKVENPDGGDATRRSGPYAGGESANFVRLNRNKRSLALDLKEPDGKAVFRALVARADIVVENLRPGTMRGLGLDYAALAREQPRLIYVAASGFGQDGPYADRPGLDIMAQAIGGLMSVTGEPGGRPMKAGVPLTDLACALYGALAAVAALHARGRDGAGQFIDVSLFESGVALELWEAGQFFGAGIVPGPHGSAHQTTAPYQAFRSGDGYVTIGAPTPKIWRALCVELGKPDLANDARFADSDARMRHIEALVAAIERVTVTRTTAQWMEALLRAGIPCAPIATFDEVAADAHLAARAFFVDLPHPTAGSVRQAASPMRFSATPVALRRAGPLLGEHTREVLDELGYAPDAIDALERRGVVATACVPS